MTRPDPKIESLLQQIAAKLADDDQHLVTSLQDTLNQSTEAQTAANTATDQPQLDSRTGCYQFGQDPAYYCPHCFDRFQQKAPTQRLNRKLRVCSQCRTSLKPL